MYNSDCGMKDKKEGNVNHHTKVNKNQVGGKYKKIRIKKIWYFPFNDLNHIILNRG